MWDNKTLVCKTLNAIWMLIKFKYTFERVHGQMKYDWVLKIRFSFSDIFIMILFDVYD